MASREQVFAAAVLPSGGGRVIATPFQFPFSGEDDLRITSWSMQAGLTVGIHGRMLKPDGSVVPFTRTHLTDATRQGKTDLFRPGEGFLLNLSAVASGNGFLVGRAFLRVQIVRGADSANPVVLGTLAQGYLNTELGLAFPGSEIRQSHDFSGNHRLAVLTTPGLGTEISDAVPDGAAWEVITARMDFTASGVAATRRLSLQFCTSTGLVLFSVEHPVQPTAGQSLALWWGVGAFTLGAASTSGQAQGLPDRMRLQELSQIRTSTVNLQAGDQYNNPLLFVREFLECRV